MKKFYLIMTFIFCSTVCFGAITPTVSGKGSISENLPESVTPPTQIFKTENITGPIPTNKWFNSILYGCYDSDPTNINKYSFKMYTYPQVVKCDDQPVSNLCYGLLIEAPKAVFSNTIDYEINYGVSPWGTRVVDNYPNALKISPYKTCYYNTENPLDTTNNGAKLDKYSDWSATAKWIDDNESYRWMKATFGQGFVYTYFEFSDNVYPAIEFPYDWDTQYSSQTCRYYLYDTKTGDVLPDTLFRSSATYQNDSLLLHVKLPNKDLFYAIFAPTDTNFFQVEDTAYGSAGLTKPWIKISMILPDNKKYMSVALLPSKTLDEAKQDIKEYYKYAYNFVINTRANWSVNTEGISKYAQTEFLFEFDAKRSGVGEIFGEQVSFIQNETIFCMFPHQYKNLKKEPSSYNKEIKSTLRGDLKLYKGNNFSTQLQTNGIVPFFKYIIPDNIKNIIQVALNIEKNYSIDPIKSSEQNTYYYGKNLAKMANLIPIAENLGLDNIKDELITKVKNELINWYSYTSGETSKYFAFDKTWGGLIGILNGFGSQDYNDHNFHYGYFIYASAIVAMYDDNFKNNYKGMIKLLTEDIANITRGDESFPYMRSFDFYESHSWANGMGGSNDDGIDIESSSEAMNAWAAIYLWGLATNNENYINLGLYLYTSEYNAIKNYFYITGQDSAVKDIFRNAGYNKNSFGILYAGVCKYKVHWDAQNGAREYKGIHLLPMTSSMLYVGYDLDYAQSFYSQMKLETPNNYYWNDIWTRFEALFNPSQAWKDFIANPEIDDGGTKSYTYHFIDFFKEYGTPDNTYTADIPSYLVVTKDGTATYYAYNYTSSAKTVNFYKNSQLIGNVTIPARSSVLTSKLYNDKEKESLEIFPIPYKPSDSNYGGNGIHFKNLEQDSNIRIFNIAGELVYDKIIDDNNKDFIWNVKNRSGNKIASGIYIYYIITPDGTKYKGKLAIER